MDVVSRQKRSQFMAGITAKDTRPEVLIRKLLHRAGFRFRLHVSDLSGKPDLVLPKYNLCIFVHGCFWHRHASCKYAYTPKSRTEFWENKFSQNIQRDSRNIKQLLDSGWRVIVIWECITRSSSAEKIIQWLPEAITNTKCFQEFPAAK